MLDFSQNYFELLGLPVGFALDRDRLAERYRSLLASVHPDRFANASEQERRLSMQAATLINEANATLRSPLARARYLLELKGGDLGPDHATSKDAAFLMEQMELRERLAEAEEAVDPLAVVGEVMARLDTMRRAVEGRLAELLETSDAAALTEAADLIRKLQFLEKAQHDAELLEERLLDLA